MRILQRSRTPSGARAVGRMIDGRFLLVDRLGEGRSATVYSALDSAGPPVALKLGNPCPYDGEAFSFEARALSRLEQRGIVRLIRSGIHEGAPYIAMERMMGDTLRSHLMAHRPGLVESLAIVHSLCEALAHAHSRGIVHRDVKPKNIMRLIDGRIKIFDFGFAMVDGKGLRPSALMGNPLYMAPEQTIGEGECDLRADIYAAGIIMYQLVSMRKSISHYIDMLKITGARLGPSLLVRGKEGPEKDARRIISKALAFPPERRFQSADEMRDAVADVLGKAQRQIRLQLE